MCSRLHCDKDLSDDDMSADASVKDKDGVYILRSIDFFFLATIRLIGATNYEINLIPTPKNGPMLDSENSDDASACVELSVYPNSRVSDPDRPQMNEKCSLGSDLQKKSGTKQMHMSALSFASKILNQSVYRFTDASYVLCDGERISIRDYGLLVDNQTWYQRVFDAKSVSFEDELELEKYKIRL